jgi:hypothetical protein
MTRSYITIRRKISNLMNYNFLPPTEVSQLQSLLALLADPMATKQRLAELEGGIKAANTAATEAQKAKAEADEAFAEAGVRKQETEIKLAALNAAMLEHDQRKGAADQAEAQATGAQNALVEKTKQLELRERAIAAREQEFETTRAKFKSLVS